MVGPFEQQAEVSLEFAVVGGEHHVDVVGPPPGGDRAKDPAERLVDQFALHRVAGVDLAHLV